MDPELLTVYSKNQNLKRLHYWLKYELSSSALLLLSWLWGFAILLSTIAAAVFTPFMIYILFEEKKFGWIIFFIIMIILPAITITIFFLHSNYFLVLALIPLALFYFYCFLLRLTVSDWLS
jgi:hypothetical protein